MFQFLLFLLAICVALLMFSMAMDALMVHEYEITNRALIHQAGVNAGIREITNLPIPTLPPLPPTPIVVNSTVVVIP